MKKKLLTCAGGLLAGVFLLMAVFGGKVFSVETDFGSSQLHRQGDIRFCANLVKWHFFCNFHGSRLNRLSYDEAFNLRFGGGEAASGEAKDALILHSDWTGGSFGAEEPGHVYRNWKWIFEKTPMGFWELTGAGYG